MNYELETEPFELGEEFETEPEADGEFEEETLITHPSLGYGRRVAAEFEFEEEGEEPEIGRVISHPLLGPGRVVSAEAEFEEGEAEEEIIGADDRIIVADTKKAPYRWVCCLDLYFPDPDNKKALLFFRGSGTLIGEKHVLTCGHNLINNIDGSKGTTKKLAVKKIVVTPGRWGAGASAKDKAPFGDSKAASFRTTDEWKDRLDRQYDFAVIKLQKALGKGSLGYWGSPSSGQKTRIEVVAPADMKGKTVNLSGYPGDKCKHLPAVGSASQAALQACSEADWASTQWRASGKVLDPSPAGASKLIYYDPDTFGGHSGSPVWFYYPSSGIRNLIAIHTGSIGGSNRGVRITKDVLDKVKKWM
ncbi:MAG: trypsin-like peptidase domain-containing protein [Bryobacterales bacterium]|nr:trypsin-like peptidase domain-containing protein [Bryobacterales bacterium]